MLLIKTKLQQSSIHGLGLFADEFIAKGTLIWKLQSDFDVILTQQQFHELPKLTQEYILHFSYFHKNKKCHILCGDNARFFNKSESPNCSGEGDDITIALRDIQQGEELTELYFNINELNHDDISGSEADIKSESENQNEMWKDANRLFSTRYHSEDGRDLQMLNFIIKRKPH